MLIKKVHIEKFRGFHDQEFEVGSMLTAIAGQNGTQKSTLLGMITQTFLHDLSEADELWENITEGYSKQVCFRDITYDEILHDRIKAKTWFRSQLPSWCRTASKVLTPLFKKYKDERNEFISDFEEMIKLYQV